jgi:hypothetical protein
MKTAIYSSVFTLVCFWSLTVFGQGSCQNNNGGGGYPGGNQQAYLYENADPYGAGGQGYPGYPGPYANQLPPTYPPAPQYAVPTSNASPQLVAAVAAAAAAPKGPTARITVVSANSSATALASLKSSAAKLTIVADVPQTVEVAVAEPEPVVVDEKIASLVGTWKAVARQGDGQLTTVELHLDNRGWAELTVPGTDGKPSTTKSRVNLDNEELKLTDADKVVSLGKLVDFNTRQMVLERAEGQVTFVRL